MDEVWIVEGLYFTDSGVAIWDGLSCQSTLKGAEESLSWWMENGDDKALRIVHEAREVVREVYR